MKTCFKCGQEKPLSEFYAHPAMADGHLGKCKACQCAAMAGIYESRKLDPVWVAKERKRGREKMSLARSVGKFKKQPSYSVKKRWIQKNRLKSRAHLKARRHIPKVQNKECDHCGVIPEILHRHHPDYTKPLEILWLCPTCHGLQHRKPFGAAIKPRL